MVPEDLLLSFDRSEEAALRLRYRANAALDAAHEAIDVDWNLGGTT